MVEYQLGARQVTVRASGLILPDTIGHLLADLDRVLQGCQAWSVVVDVSRALVALPEQQMLGAPKAKLSSM